MGIKVRFELLSERIKIYTTTIKLLFTNTTKTVEKPTNLKTPSGPKHLNTRSIKLKTPIGLKYFKYRFRNPKAFKTSSAQLYYFRDYEQFACYCFQIVHISKTKCHIPFDSKEFLKKKLVLIKESLCLKIKRFFQKAQLVLKNQSDSKNRQFGKVPWKTRFVSQESTMQVKTTQNIWLFWAPKFFFSF